MKEANSLSVREMAAEDLEHFIWYWAEATPAHLEGMGVGKKPSSSQVENLVTSQFGLPMEEKKAYFLPRIKDGMPVGSARVNYPRLHEVGWFLAQATAFA